MLEKCPGSIFSSSQIDKALRSRSVPTVHLEAMGMKCDDTDAHSHHVKMRSSAAETVVLLQWAALDPLRHTQQSVRFHLSKTQVLLPPKPQLPATISDKKQWGIHLSQPQREKYKKTLSK